MNAKKHMLLAFFRTLLALIPAEKGDYLFILSNSGRIIVEGYYTENQHVRSVEVQGRSFKVSNNIPEIHKSKKFNSRLIGSQKLMDLFSEKKRAVLIKDRSKISKESLDALIEGLNEYRKKK